MTLHNVERHLPLAALVVGTSKIRLASLSTSDTNCFRDAFNYEIMFIASCFLSAIFFKAFIWVSNLNLSRSLLKSEDIAKVHGQNIHATLLKAVFPLALPEKFQCSISAEITIQR